MNDEIEKLEEQISTLTVKLAKLRKKSLQSPEGFRIIRSQRRWEPPTWLRCSAGSKFFLPSTTWARAVVIAPCGRTGSTLFCHIWRTSSPWCCFPKIFQSCSNGSPTREAGGSGWLRMEAVPTSRSRPSCGGEDNMPGLVCYVRDKGEIFRKSSAVFGPGDLYCSLWHVLSLAGIGTDDWTPQYGYWKRPARAKMDDGARNLQ